MQETVLFWVAALTASVLVGAAKGGLPVVGMLSVPILSLVMSPVMAAGLLLPVYVVSDMFGVWAYRHAFDRRNLAILIPGAVVGIGIGWATAALVPDRAVTGLVGVIGLVFSANLLLRRKTPAEPRGAAIGPGLFWGALTGLTSFVSHAGGPPYQVYVLPQRLSKTVFAGTTTIFFAVVNAVKLLPYWALGQLSVENLKMAAVLMLPASLAVFAGLKLVKVLPERTFFALVTWALLLVSLRLIWQAVAG